MLALQCEDWPMSLAGALKLGQTTMSSSCQVAATDFVQGQAAREAHPEFTLCLLLCQCGRPLLDDLPMPCHPAQAFRAGLVGP